MIVAASGPGEARDLQVGALDPVRPHCPPAPVSSTEAVYDRLGGEAASTRA
jgi:hypothetical protein